MTRRQKIRLNMYLSLRNLKNQYATIMSKIPKFEASFEALQDKINQIQMVSEQQGINKTGVTHDKNRLRKNLTITAVKFASKAAILARLNNNQTLLEEVKFKESYLEHLSGVTLRDKAQIIYDIVQANIRSLEDQGVTAQTQTKFLEMIIAFNKALSTPRTGTAERSQATRKLPLLFAEADAAIEILDLAVESEKDEQPEFFSAYRSSRVLVDNNPGGIRLKGIAVDFISREPLKGVLFSFSHKGLKSPGARHFIKKSAKKGGFNIRNMDSGTYNVSVTKPGYKGQEIIVTISEGDRSEIRVEMEKV